MVGVEVHAEHRGCGIGERREHAVHVTTDERTTTIEHDELDRGRTTRSREGELTDEGRRCDRSARVPKR